jgi:hypothetical protein
LFGVVQSRSKEGSYTGPPPNALDKTVPLLGVNFETRANILFKNN